MTGSDLLDAMEFLPEDMLAEAQTLRASRRTYRKLPKIWLIAAVLAALLAGCVAGVLWLQNYSLGQEPYSKEFDENGLAIPAETHYWEVVPGHGQKGEAVYEAQREWLEFLKTDQGEAVPNETDLPEISNRYEYSYGCYTPEMAAKVDEIAEKYGLRLLEKAIPVQRWQWEVFWDAAGMENFIKPGTEITGLQAMCYPPGNFNAALDLRYDDHWYPMTLSCSRKDYLPQNGYWLLDLEGARQWEHEDLLLALIPQESGWIFANRGTDMLALQIRGDLSTEALEAIAGLFNFTVTPKDLDAEALTAELSLAEQAHQKALENSSLQEFSIENGAPADYNESVDVPVPAEEVRQKYQDLLTRLDQHHYTHFGIADINGDGVEDLLLSGDGLRYWSAYTYRSGKIVTLFWGDFLLCEDGVLEMHSEVYEPSGRVLDRHRYVRIQEDQQILLWQVTYDRSTASWWEDPEGSPLTEEEARRYPLIDQGMNFIP